MAVSGALSSGSYQWGNILNWRSVVRFPVESLKGRGGRPEVVEEMLTGVNNISNGKEVNKTEAKCETMASKT
jgi:hypothetical protein